MRQLVDDSSTPLVPAGLSYSPFGTPQSGAQPDPFGFTGELHHGGLQYLRARWYDPGEGVLLGRDPFAGYATRPYSQHYYQYGYSAPTMWTDPSGLSPDSGEQYRHRYRMEITVSDELLNAMEAAFDRTKQIEEQRSRVTVVGSILAGAVNMIGNAIVSISVDVGRDVAVEWVDVNFNLADTLDGMHNVSDLRATLEEMTGWMDDYLNQHITPEGLAPDIDSIPPMTLWIEDRSSCYHGDDWTGQPWSCMCTFGLQEKYVMGADWTGSEHIRSTLREHDTMRNIDKFTYRDFRDKLPWGGYTRNLSFGSPRFDDENPPIYQP